MKQYAAMFIAALLVFSAWVIPAYAEDASAVGMIDSTLSMIGAQQGECSLGKAAADAVRAVCRTDIAILPGELFYMNLSGGAVTEEMLEQSIPQEAPVGIAEITPAQLKAIMETGVGQIVIGAGDAIDTEHSDYEGFPQFSGFTVKCDYSAPAGERVLEIIMDDGTEVDLRDEEGLLTLAATEEMLVGGYGYPVLEAAPAGETVLSCMRVQLSAGMLEVPADSRMKIIGIQGNILMQNISPTIPIVILALVLVAAAVTTGRKQRKSDTTEGAENDEL